MLFAVAAEGDDEYIWSRLKMLPELFAAGPVAIRVGFFGAEGTRSSRPFMVSRWTTNPADLADLLQKARTRCICGCFVKVSSILEQALRETQQGPLRAVVIIGDSFYGDFEAAMATAKQLRAAGTRLFLFQQGRSDFDGAVIPGARSDNGRRVIFRSIPTSRSSRNGCRDCLRRSPISRSAAWQLWKRAATRRPVCCLNG